MQKKLRQVQNEILVLRCQQNDIDAFSELVQLWQKELWGYAYKMTGSKDAAYDIVQETWYGVVKGLAWLHDVSVFPCWILRLVHNKSIDWIRKEHIRSRINKELEERQDLTFCSAADTQDGVLAAAIDQLAPDHKALILLRYQEEMTIGQIAAIMDIPEGTVKSRLYRIINELRRLVERDANE